MFDPLNENKNGVELNWKGKSVNIGAIPPGHEELILEQERYSPGNGTGEGALYWGDNLDAMKFLLAGGGWEGKIDLIYIDPPFFTGLNFSIKTAGGQRHRAYKDTWANGLPQYLSFMKERLELMYRLLKDSGSIYVHLDWHVAHYVKVLLDEIFGYSSFRNQIVWKRLTYKQTQVKAYGVLHDVILYYTKGSEYTWNDVRAAYDEDKLKKYFCWVEVLTNIAVEYKGGYAIWSGYVQQCRFDHNYIIGCANTAIGGGWGWSYDLTILHDNSYQYNEITNYMMEMKDGAAIYTLSLQNNTRVEYNHIHDGAGSGLYPDEQTWMTTWRYNVVYRSGNSLQDHTLGVERNATSIRENLITNNYFDKDPIIEPKRQVTHIPNNTWNITGNPATAILAIVSSAGIEPSYQGLLQRIGTVVTRQWNGTGCASCLYWSDIPPEDQNRSLLPVAVALVIAGITGFGVAGVVVMHKQGKQSVPQATRREP